MSSISQSSPQTSPTLFPIYKIISSHFTRPIHLILMAPRHPTQFHPHFLLVTIAVQGQINPARNLARRLTRTAGARVTLATPLSSHRRMFPSSAGNPTQPIDDDVDSLISYAPYSDGFDDGFHPQTGDEAHFMTQLKLIGSQTLSHLARDLAARGRPVTCVVYTILLAWAADVAHDLAVPSVLFWIQPATVFSIYYHYFHESAADLISAHQDDPSFTLKLPGLPPLQIRDLPSTLISPGPVLDSFEEIFQTLHKQKEKTESKARVIMNTFYELESDAISAIDEFCLIPIGPLMEKVDIQSGDLFEQDRSEYMEWLDSKEDRSVVYVSFGSLSRLSKRQMEEIFKGLEECGRPYLWVVRRDAREGGEGVELAGKGEGMVVEWCNQVRVLSHRSIGCFVTHGGWNSMVESLVCGVPTVTLPQWFDQATNARMVMGEWGTGVRGEVDGEGVVEGREVRRCLDLVMGEGERGVEIRRMAGVWREKARVAMEEGGSSDLNLRAFVQEI